MGSSLKQLLYIVLITLVLTPFAQAGDITFGVQAPRGAVKAMGRWGELGEYLKSELGVNVSIVALSPSKTVEAVAAGKVDFVLANPALTLAMRENNGITPLVTINKKTGAYFSGVIISKKGSGITKAADLKGKKVMGFKFGKSAAAYVFQVKHLLDQGIDANKDFAVFKQAKKQDDIVLAVKAGAFDAGFIRSGLLESMAKEGVISMDDFEIVDSQSDSFTMVHSTELYPEWFVSATSSVDGESRDKMKAVLLKLDANSKASKKANIVGFIEPLDLSALELALRALKLPPYE